MLPVVESKISFKLQLNSNPNNHRRVKKSFFFQKIQENQPPPPTQGMFEKTTP